MIAVVAGLIEKDGRLLIARRPQGKHMAGKWEFPGGKIERGETPEAALERELFEELGIRTESGRIYHAVIHSYPEKDVLLLFYRSRLSAGTPRAIEEAECRWIGEEELDRFDWAPADRPVVNMLAEEGFSTVFGSRN
jgi:8-oxo-dGTP diphosphatase